MSFFKQSILSDGCKHTSSTAESKGLQTVLFFLGVSLGRYEKQSVGSTSQATCLPIYSILKALGNPTVDYFSLDVQGAEIGILKSIPWDKVDVRVWSIEYVLGPEHSIEDALVSFMRARGYEVKGKVGNDILFAQKGMR